MERQKFYWNLIRHSKGEKIKFISKSISYEIDQKSELWKPLNFLVYTMPRLYLRVYIFVIFLTGLSFRDLFWPSVVISLFVIIVCTIVLPLVMIPKDFNKYLPLNDF